MATRNKTAEVLPEPPSSDHDHHEGHGFEFTIILIFTLVLAIGAATRLLARLTKFPYTIAMLLLGTVAGLAIDKFGGEDGLFGLFQLPADGMLISPDLIIFVFLPALIFESSYLLDGHLFKKNLGVISMLAGPATLACTVLTATLMIWLTPAEWGWGWIAALTFGALISATDPVAVVAILKEAGAPKRLGTLIEGESLLNDGVAIVVFTVLVGLLVESGQFDLGATVVKFLVVVAGGLGVGLVLSYLFSNWIGKVFNDPTVEITLTMVLGYLGMLVAEGMLHVSGVMAIVVSGLWMAGIGRTKISPEVQHFLHKFWGMLAYIANTIIFFLVGLVVATQADKVGTGELICIVVTYLGIVGIRFVVTFGMRPVFSAMGNPVGKADATVSAWGGLRGAVSLALALAIASNEALPGALREQILVLTVGVVTLTILVNGTTVGAVIRFFRLTEPTLPVKLDTQSARVNVLAEVSEKIVAISAAPGMRRSNWGAVKEDLESRLHAESDALHRLQEQFQAAGRDHRVARCWREALNIERGAYWEGFGEGILSARTVQIMNHEIETQLDRIDRGIVDPPKSRTPKLEGSGERFVRKVGRALNIKSIQYDYVTMLYEINRAESLAAAIVIDRFGPLQGMDPQVQEEILEVYRQYLCDSNRRVEEMRGTLPEITRAIESSFTKRVALNYERDAYDHMMHHGLIDEALAAMEMERVEADMKALLSASRRISLPAKEHLLKEVPMFRFCDEGGWGELAALVEETIIPADDYLFHEGDHGDSMFIIARGAVNVMKKLNGDEILVGVLGSGDIIGEMALLTGAPRNASIRAATAVTLLEISRETFEPFVEGHPEAREEIWNAYGDHLLDNFLRRDSRFLRLDGEERKALRETQRHEYLEPTAVCRGEKDESWVFVVEGRIEAERREFPAQSMIDLRDYPEFAVPVASRVVWLREPERQ